MSAEVTELTRHFDARGASCTWVETLLSDLLWLGVKVDIKWIGSGISTLLKLD